MQRGIEIDVVTKSKNFQLWGIFQYFKTVQRKPDYQVRSDQSCLIMDIIIWFYPSRK